MAAKTARAPKPKVVTDLDATSLYVSLPQMLDLALGTPEVGAVNLNILHNFLHVLLHQANLRTTKVEYRGEDANRMKAMVGATKAGSTLHLHEYSITDGSGKQEQRFQGTDDLIVNAEVITDADGTVSSVTQLRSSASAPQTGRENLGKAEGKSAQDVVQRSQETKKVSEGLKQEIRPGVEDEKHTVIFVEPIVDGVVPTALAFKQLDQSVKQLQERFQALDELSTNSELVERLKGKITDPLTDVWQVINLTKRLDAAEQGIDKLTTMLQDVIKGEASISTEDTSGLNERLLNLEQIVTGLQTVAGVSIGIGSLDIREGAEGTIGSEDHREGKETEEGTTEQERQKSITRPVVKHHSDALDLHKTVDALKTEMAQVQKDIRDVNAKMDSMPTITTKVAPETNRSAQDASTNKTATEERSKDADGENTDRCLEAVQNVEAAHGDALHELKKRVESLERNVNELREKLNDDSKNKLNSGDGELHDLVSKIQGIQSDMERLGQTAERLLEDRESREAHINALLEQVELLKNIKADKEDLEDALADKADAQVLTRKVSHDQFDAACDDLARGLEDAISKIGKQEFIWQEALDEVQREIESKVDKIEMTPLKDFVNNRLKTLQEKLKTISDMRRENEAAGTKKMLRDVQCLSCDKNVVMRMEESGKFHADPLPCSASMKPYLTYELDQVRKQQKRLPHGRNMIQFEAAMQEESRKMKSARDDPLMKTPRDHLCNRYCGGKHTVTTPQQRVTRVGHFLQQWGPQIVQLTDDLIKGTDGQLYRGRLVAKPDVCGPSCDSQRNESQRAETDQPQLSARKTSQTRRNSIGPQRLSSKKVSGSSQIVESTERTLERIPSIHFHDVDEFPIDPTAHTDELRYDNEDLEHAENIYNA